MRKLSFNSQNIVISHESEEEKSVDPLFIIDDIPSFEYLPKYDQYDDNYILQIQANFTEQSEASFWDEETQFQQPE